MKSPKGLPGTPIILALCLVVLLACSVHQPPTPVPTPIPTPMPTPTAGPTIPSAVKEHIRELVDNEYSRGIVVALIDASGTTYYSYGKMSRDGAPVNERTIFEIGSVSKVFTAILLADLVERGVVTLDTPIEKYLPPEVRVPERNAKKITLEHLATHRSGLPRMPTNWKPKDPNNPYVDYTTKDLYEFLSSYTLPRDPGDKYEYSNAGAGLLGQILARLADKSYEQLVVDRISQPLGLNDTRITLSEEQRNRFARGHLGDGREVGNWEFDSLAGAGALRSSAADLARFVAANLGLYKTDLYAALKRTHQVRADAGAPGAEIGLGWHAGMVYGAQIVGHDGGTGGYRSSCNFIPSRNVGAVVLSNSNFDIGYISTHLLEPQVPLRRVLKPIPVAPGVLAGYAGTYEVVPGSMGASAVLINVAVANEILMVQLTGDPTYPVYPATETVFYYRVANTFIQFQKDDKGNVVGLILYTEGIPFEAKKIK